MAGRDDHPDVDREAEAPEGGIHVSECGEEERPSFAVIRVVAAVTGRMPTRMRPLREAVDPDALDQLFGSGPTDRSPNGSVNFRFEGCAVTVSAADPTLVSVAPDERH